MALRFSNNKNEQMGFGGTLGSITAAAKAPVVPSLLVHQRKHQRGEPVDVRRIVVSAVDINY